VELQFEITRRFEKDLDRLSLADQARVAASIDRYAASFDPEAGDPSGHVYRSREVLLPQGMQSTLYVLRATRDIRAILAIDEDPLFDRKLVTLFRAVKHSEIERAFRSIAESLYQHLSVSQKRRDNGRDKSVAR
jgi:hypothetical protein